MKILIATDWIPPNYVGGAERTIKELEDYLSAQNCSVFYLSIKQKIDQSRKTRNNVHSFPALRMRRRANSHYILKLIDKIIGLIDPVSPILMALKARSLKCDLILVHQVSRFGIFFSLVLRFVVPKKVTIVRVFHDLSETCIKRTRFRKYQICRKTCLPCRPLTFVGRVSSNYYDFKIFNSKFTLNKYAELGYSVEKSFVGHPYILNEDTITELNIDNHASTLIADSADIVRIGFVGRVCAEKGVKSLVQALGKADTPYELHTVGYATPKFQNELNNIASQLNLKLTSHGYKEQPFRYISEFIDLVVVSSELEEAFGRVVIEAASFGLPILVANVGGLPEATKLIKPEPMLYDPENFSFPREQVNAARVQPETIVLKHADSMAYPMKTILKLIERRKNS